jgi:hypothetical protein
MHAWIGLIMDFHIFEGPAGFKSSNRQRTCVGKVPLHFKLELSTVGPLSIPSDINLKDGGGVNDRADLEKQIFANILIRTFFLIFVCGESLLISFQGV